MFIAFLISLVIVAALAVAIVFLAREVPRLKKANRQLRRQKRIAQTKVGEFHREIADLTTRVAQLMRERDNAYRSLELLLEHDKTVVPIGKHATEKEAR